MNSGNLAKGLVVRLTAGDPQMTVGDFGDTLWGRPTDVDCVWLQDGIIKRATFNSELLEKCISHF